MLTPERLDDLRLVQRATLRYLEREGVAPDDVTLHTYASERDKWLAWCAETMWRAATDMLVGHATHVADRSEPDRYGWTQAVKYGFRGFALAREYRGQCKGFLCSALADQLTRLQNVLEAEIGA